MYCRFRAEIDANAKPEHSHCKSQRKAEARPRQSQREAQRARERPCLMALLSRSANIKSSLPKDLSLQVAQPLLLSRSTPRAPSSTTAPFALISPTVIPPKSLMVSHSSYAQRALSQASILTMSTRSLKSKQSYRLSTLS